MSQGKESESLEGGDKEESEYYALNNSPGKASKSDVKVSVARGTRDGELEPQTRELLELRRRKNTVANAMDMPENTRSTSTSQFKEAGIVSQEDGDKNNTHRVDQRRRRPVDEQLEISAPADSGWRAVKILISNARKLLTVDTENDIMARASMLKEAQLRGSREGPIERTGVQKDSAHVERLWRRVIMKVQAVVLPTISA
ncbi:hypothetical protein B0H13DRAFT_1902051 [Mycena leptocephala]|nr:hypothetical protein B0H13DRAFT_1902051 [Mycena leptocephala]